MHSSIARVIAAEWDRLGSPGTWWTGTQRTEIGRQARRARDGEPVDDSELPDLVIEAIRKIAVDAHTIDQAWIQRCHERGLEPLPMVELLAVIAKLVAIDTFLEGTGEQERPLPESQKGEPSRAIVEGATINGGWLPTKGTAGAPVCFSAVAAEEQAWHELHSVLYLSTEEMRDLDVNKDGLHRSQIELLAARTSHYNDCFY